MVSELLARNGFKSEELELMFTAPISSMPPVNVGELSNAAVDKGKKVVDETAVVEGKSEVDNDERLFMSFKPRAVIYTDITDLIDMLMKSKEHVDYFKSLTDRGVLNQRIVDFNFLENSGILLKQYFDVLRLTSFLTERGTTYPALTAFFYSSVTFHSASTMEFFWYDRTYLVRVEDIVHIIGCDHRDFSSIVIDSD